jgi:hypothetical protein
VALLQRAVRNASSAQYWRRTFTGRSIAAAPAARVAAACSLSAVPENRMRLRASTPELSSPVVLGCMTHVYVRDM